MTTLKINITKDILKASKNCTDYKRGQNCAIGKAIYNIFPNSRVGISYIHFAVTLEDTINLDSDKLLLDDILISLPYKVSEFIMDFDSNSPEKRENMDEFSFEIEIPDSVIETINIDDVKEIIKNTPHLELV